MNPTRKPKTTAIVLAAGQGTRMKSAKPKVLHELCGSSMVHYVVQAALDAGADDVVVVVGHGREEVRRALAPWGERVRTAVQEQQRGTGDAVRAGLGAVAEDAEQVFVLCGDTPLLQAASLERLFEAMAASKTAPIAMLTFRPDPPRGYGRILRDASGKVRAIREEKDCSPEERGVREANPGIYLARAAFVREAIRALRPDNAQGELYFTDVVARAAEAGGVVAVAEEDAGSLVGINDRAQLALAEEALFERIATMHRLAGATIRAGARIGAAVVVEPEAVIEHGVVLRGETRVGAGARIDVGSVLEDVVVEEGAQVLPYTVATSATIGKRAKIGPFSHLRPESQIDEEAHIGNFVETKKTRVRRGAKANHLAYLGDGDIGEEANVGAGTIFCNYDGFRKHKTEIGARAFIGSDSQIVAPVRIGAGAYVGTGTTVVEDVPEDALAIGRARQANKEGYASKLRERLKGGGTK